MLKMPVAVVDILRITLRHFVYWQHSYQGSHLVAIVYEQLRVIL